MNKKIQIRLCNNHKYEKRRIIIEFGMSWPKHRHQLVISIKPVNRTYPTIFYSIAYNGDIYMQTSRSGWTKISKK